MGNNWIRLTRFPVQALFTINTLARNDVLPQSVVSFNCIFAYFAFIHILSRLRRCSVLSLKVFANLG